MVVGGMGRRALQSCHAHEWSMESSQAPSLSAGSSLPSSPSSVFQSKSLFDRMDCLGTIPLETEQVEEGYNFNDAAIFHRGQRGADSEVPTNGNGDGYSGGSGGSGDKECLLSMNAIAVHGSIQR